MLLQELLKLHNAKLAEWSDDHDTDEDDDPDDMKNAPPGTYMEPISREKFIDEAKKRGLWSKEAMKAFAKKIDGQSIDNLYYDDLGWLFTDGAEPSKVENRWAITDALSAMVDSVLGDEFEAQDRKDAATIQKIKDSCFDDLRYERDATLKAAKTAVFKYWFERPLDKGGMNGLSLDEWRLIDPDKIKIETDSKETISRSANASVWTDSVTASMDFAGHHFTVDNLRYGGSARSLS
jgi:hypothetical protein